MKTFLVQAHCAGIRIFEKNVFENQLNEFMTSTNDELKNGELKISFALEVQSATEVCLDVYEKETHVYRFDLSKAFKL